MTDQETRREALDHAWRWFHMHAAQRLQFVNFFILGTAFLTAGYAAALDAGRPEVSLGIGVMAVLLCFYFLLVEIRTKALVEIGEKAMKPLEAELAARVDVAELAFVENADAAAGLATYGKALPAMYVTVGIGFTVATLVAAMAWADA